MNKKIIPLLLINILLLTTINSISAEARQIVDLKNDNEAKWTVMLYLDGDNNLETFALQNFLQIAEYGSNDEVKFVVLFDRIKNDKDWDNTTYGNWADCRRGIINHGDVPSNGEDGNSEWGESREELNMGDPQTLIDFVDWSVDNYPAEKYCLILWNHGFGEEGICYDDTSNGDYIKTAGELNSAIENIKNKLERKLDLLVLDACLMSMLEVAYEVKDCANYLIASQNIDYTSSWDYGFISKLFKQNSNQDESFIGKKIVENHPDEKIIRAFPDEYRIELTCFLIDLSKIDNVVESLNKVISNIQNSDSLKDIVTAFYHTYRYPNGLWWWEPCRNADLFNLVNKIIGSKSTTTEIRNNCKDLKNQITDLIEVDNNYFDNSHGLSIFTPFYDDGINSCDYYLNETYQMLEDSDWDDFLRWYLDIEDKPDPGDDPKDKPRKNPSFNVRKEPPVLNLIKKIQDRPLINTIIKIFSNLNQI